MNLIPFLKIVLDVDCETQRVLDTHVINGVLTYLVLETSGGDKKAEQVCITEYNDCKEKCQSHELNLEGKDPCYGWDREDALSSLKEETLQSLQNSLIDAVNLLDGNIKFCKR